jgi:hypothetical protein
LAAFYRRVIAEPKVQTAIAGLFILSAISGIATLIVPDARDEVHANVIATISILVSSAFNVIGVLALRRSRYEAFRWFERSMLITILITQVFLFNDDGLIAVFTLVFNLLIYGALKFALAQEREAGRDTIVPSAADQPRPTAA